MAGIEHEGTGARWRSLHGSLLGLREAIAREEDPDKRSALLTRLKATQEAIAELERAPDERAGLGQGGDENVDELLESLGIPLDESSSGLGPGRHTRERVRRPRFGSVLVGAVGMAALLGVAGLGWWLVNRSDDESDPGQESATSVDESAEVDTMQVLLDVMGQTTVDAELRGSVVYLVGAVATEADRTEILAAADRLAGTLVVDSSELVVIEPVVAATSAEQATQNSDPRSQSLQQELDRVLSVDPIVFSSGRIDLTTTQVRLLNTTAGLLRTYPDVAVKVVGFTDGSDEETGNAALSLERAEAVRDYLISQGVPESMLTAEGRDEISDAAGSSALAGLQRRVELEVVAATPAEEKELQVAVVAPSASNDLASTQSMVDAVMILAGERGNMEVEIVDNAAAPSDAAAAVRAFAERGFDLVIVHGSQFGEVVLGAAPDYPDVVFAWGPVNAASGEANVYTYDAAAEEGGYVMGVLAALSSTSEVVGVVGSIEVADSQRYVNGFEAGVLAQHPSATVLVTYTGSFSDIAAAAEVATAHAGAGADVLTGTSELAIGALSVAQENGLVWFANQADQTPLAPSSVAASQVYRWEVALRPIVAEIDADSVNGRLWLINLANGGLIVQYNTNVLTSQAHISRADELTAAIASGTIDPLPG